MFEMLVAFYIHLVLGSRYEGGKIVQGVYKPEVVYQTMEECNENKKMIQDWFVEEANRLYPDNKGVKALGLCTKKINNKGEVK